MIDLKIDSSSCAVNIKTISQSYIRITQFIFTDNYNLLHFYIGLLQLILEMNATGLRSQPSESRDCSSALKSRMA